MIVSSLFRCHPSSVIGLMSWLDDTISRAVHTYTTQPFIHCMYTLYGGPNKDFFLPYILYPQIWIEPHWNIDSILAIENSIRFEWNGANLYTLGEPDREKTNIQATMIEMRLIQ